MSLDKKLVSVKVKALLVVECKRVSLKLISDSFMLESIRHCERVN